MLLLFFTLAEPSTGFSSLECSIGLTKESRQEEVGTKSHITKSICLFLERGGLLSENNKKEEEIERIKEGIV